MVVVIESCFKKKSQNALHVVLWHGFIILVCSKSDEQWLLYTPPYGYAEKWTCLLLLLLLLLFVGRRVQWC